MKIRTIWWGRGQLKNKRKPGFSGVMLPGVSGCFVGRYDQKFVEWCRKRGYLCVRTVDLAWAFGYFGDGFPQGIEVRELRKSWEDKKNARREAFAELKLHAKLREAGRPRPTTLIKLSNGFIFLSRYFDREAGTYFEADLSLVSGSSKRDLVNTSAPDPGGWEKYLARWRTYFRHERARYDGVNTFWRNAAHPVRRAIRRCAFYSNRRPESHPDYFVIFRDARRRMNEFGFVEVKGPLESLRPSQKRFFPELVECANQKVFLARCTVKEDTFDIRMFKGNGELVSWQLKR